MFGNFFYYKKFASNFHFQTTDPSHPGRSLIFDASLKLQLMHYVETAMLFSHAGVNATLVTFNRCRGAKALLSVSRFFDTTIVIIQWCYFQNFVALCFPVYVTPKNPGPVVLML